MKKLFLALLFVVAVGTAVAQGVKVTNKGVGPLKTNMTIDQVPASAEGLYDRVVLDDSFLTHLNFYMGEDLVMKGEVSGNTIYQISIFEKANVYVELLGKKYRMGDNIKALMQSSQFTFWRNTGTLVIDDELSLSTKIRDDHRDFTDILFLITVTYFDPNDNEP